MSANEPDDSIDSIAAALIGGISRQALAAHDAVLKPERDARGRRRYSRAAVVQWAQARLTLRGVR